MLSQPKTYMKAITAGLLAGLSALLAALGGEPSITTAEWVTIALAVIGAGAAVYGIPNLAPSGTRAIPTSNVRVIPPGEHARPD